MGIMRGGNGGKSASTAKSASPDGLSTMKQQGAPKGVNPNKGYPTAANMSGDRGGSPGIKPANGGGRGLGAVHLGQAGSGHDMTESKRSSSVGYGNVHKSLKGKC